MKVELLLNLLLFVAIAYSHEAAVEQDGHAIVDMDPQLDADNSALMNHAKTVHFIRSSSPDEEVLSDDSTEYFLPILVRAIKRAITAHNIRKNKNRG